MKKTLFLGFLILLCACDDGDLQIEQVDFQEVDVLSCGDLEELTETTFFFKIDQDEALLLNLASGLLKNETSTLGTLSSSIPAPSNLIYRLFSENVSQAYFCDAIPPLVPTVLSENNAEAGDIAIDTKVSAATKDNKSYSHTISITGLSLTNDQQESITDSSTFEYGNYTTTVENSARLATPFSNYETITSFLKCVTAPSEGSIRLYKLINDEFISLDIPSTSLMNVSTAETEARKVNLENGVFKYVVLDILVTTEMACSMVPLSEEITSWKFISTAGELSIETVENTPDADGKISFTHSFTLEKVILNLEGDGAEVKDVPLTEIETVNMGSYTTF